MSELELNYEKATAWLFEQFPSYQVIGSKAYKPTLDNTFRILELFNNPQQSLTFIHVAGSNGKGSVCSLTASILTESGKKVGLFTSPHILDFTERIRINGSPIEKESVVNFIEVIRNSKLDFSPSFFEITFAMALDHFKKSNCDVCVIETGLGGRLDATNVISPILSVITSISLEHTNILGETLEEIATEKAGIIKPTGNVVLGKLNETVLPVFLEKAKEAKVTVIDSSKTDTSHFAHKFIANYQLENLATTITTVRNYSSSINDETVFKGIENLYNNSGYQGRLQIISRNPLLIFDVSHNPDGIRVTFDSILEINKGNLHVVYGTSSDKNLNLIKNIFPKNAAYYFTEFSNSRSANLDDLKDHFNRINLKSTHYYHNAKNALEAAKGHSSENDTILVIGSFFLLSDFF